MYSTRTSAPSHHTAIPDKGTWSLSSIIHPVDSADTSQDMLTEQQLVKLHKLAALVPPSAPQDVEKLNKQLHTLLRLVRGIHNTSPRTESSPRDSENVDSRILAQDAAWHTTLSHPDKPVPGLHEEDTAALDRDSELLSHVDNSRKYGGYFVVRRS